MSSALFLIVALIAARDASTKEMKWGSEKEAKKARDLYKNSK